MATSRYPTGRSALLGYKAPRLFGVLALPRLHVLWDEALSPQYGHLVESGVRTPYLPNVRGLHFCSNWEAASSSSSLLPRCRVTSRATRIRGHISSYPVTSMVLGCMNLYAGSRMLRPSSCLLRACQYGNRCVRSLSDRSGFLLRRPLSG